MDTNKRIFIGVVPLLLGPLLLVLVNLHYAKNVNSLAEDGQWLEEKISKTAFMQAAGAPYDVVFLGSSRTQNHINTHRLKEKGINAFNLGLPSQFLFDMLYPVKQAAKSTKKIIVITTKVDQLFSKKVRFPNYPSFTDLTIPLEFPSTISGIKISRLIKLFPVNRSKDFMEVLTQGKKEHDRLFEEMDSLFDYGSLNDPRSIHYIRTGSNPSESPRYVVLYSNGDGQVFCSRVKPGQPIKTINYENAVPNESIVEFVNMLARVVKEESPSATLVLNLISGRHSQRFAVNMEKIQSLFPNCIIMESQYAVDSKYWADEGHLNYEGVQLYTDKLMSQLSGLLN